MVRGSVLLPLAAAAGALAQDGDGVIIPNRYVVEFEDNADVPAFYGKLDRGAAFARKNFTYQLFRGASIEMTGHEEDDPTLQEIREMPGIRMWPVKVIPRPDDVVHWAGSASPAEIQAAASLARRQDGGAEEKDTFSTHVQTQIDLLRADGITGKGIKIAVIDTGIDYTHPAMGGCFGDGCLVSFGTDLVGDDYTGGTSIPVPDDDPMDCGGHGTHVASIIAAQPNTWNFTGAAPGVTLGAYRAFGCVGGVENDVLIAAFNQAYEDGADIISASVGGPSGWSEDPWAVAVQRIVEKGVPCVLAAGNDGAKGMFYAASASSGKGILSVGSIDNSVTPNMMIQSSYRISGGDDDDEGEGADFPWTAGTPLDWGDVTLPLYALDFNITDEADGCAPWPSDTPNLRNHIALIRRGTCTFVEKATFAAAKGARYIMIYNNVPGSIVIDLSEVSGIQGAAMVDPQVGESWIAALEEGKEVIVSMSNPQVLEKVLTTTPNEVTGGSLSGFTSWGPTWELDVKPIISAPGGAILAAYPVDLGGYAVLSGTSMATPLIAGVLALIAEARGTLDPMLLERLLANTAMPQRFNYGNGTVEVFAPVPQQGNGVIRAYDAAYTTTILDKSSLSFNDTDHRIESASFRIFNEGDEELTYEMGHIQAATAYLKNATEPVVAAMFPNDLVTEYATLDFDPKSVTIAPGGDATITVTATEPEGLDTDRLPVWSGWVSVNASDGTSYRLAYQGVTGSMKSLTIAAKAYLVEVPPVAQRPMGSVWPPATEGLSFVLPAQGTSNSTPAAFDPTTYPGFFREFAVGAAKTEYEMVRADDGETIGFHRVSPDEWESRTFNVLGWDGELSDGTFAPEGAYLFRMRSLKIFGDQENEDDWEVVESVSFNIRYAERRQSNWPFPPAPGIGPWGEDGEEGEASGSS